jgi:hypothetical protein
MKEFQNSQKYYHRMWFWKILRKCFWNFQFLFRLDSYNKHTRIFTLFLQASPVYLVTYLSTLKVLRMLLRRIIIADMKGRASKNYRDPAVRKGTWDPSMLHMSLAFSVVLLFPIVKINPFRKRPSHCNWKSFRFIVEIFSRAAFAGGLEFFFTGVQTRSRLPWEWFIYRMSSTCFQYVFLVFWKRELRRIGQN